MSEAEKREIYCVADYPASDLHDQTPGTPPDKDFSNAKPATQVNAGVFANYVEPYIRPLVEEDVAFLRERVSSSSNNPTQEYSVDTTYRGTVCSHSICLGEV
jgi:transcriptional adapter 3